ncbi:hypothetical protein MNV49_002584 [Pseudohyphozyma bogoriensis]|nr:hypothetical protein MNV49_002584 [Pseudohyphozyma bogoriensis]
MPARLSPSLVPKPRSPNPHYLDSLARALPSSQITNTAARHPELIRPPPAQIQRSFSLSTRPSYSTLPGSARARSTSVGSLKEVLARGGGEGVARSPPSSFRSLTMDRRSSGSIDSVSDSLPSTVDEESQPAEGEAEQSWTKWWPLRIVPPEDVKGKGKATDQVEASKESSRSFLEFFGGKGAVEAAKTEHAETTKVDDAEAELLGASLETLKVATTVDEGSLIENASGSFKQPHHGRPYSSGHGDGGTKRSEVEEFLDDEDKKAAKAEDDSHMDMFTLIKDRYRCPQNPIVFCHGLFGFDTIGPAAIKPLQFSYWVGVKEALDAIGAEVLIGVVPASASIEERAKVLCEQIEQAFPGREGGLDARFLISRLKPTTFKVISLTTLATPHRGSSFADFFLNTVVGMERAPAIFSLLGAVGIPGGGKAFYDLTTEKMQRFNDETPDDPNVKYFSYGAEFRPSWSNVFRPTWGHIFEHEGDNDGLVSVQSAKWGHYRGTLHNVNHLDLVGWVGKIRFGWAEWLGKPIKFKPISFYCALTEELADEGL